MTDKTFAETIGERIAAIELVTSLIAQEGRGSSLRDLRVLLINIMSLLKRDPGIEAAADDLYAAAAVVVSDISAGAQPGARRLRFLRDARERFCSRLPGVANRRGPQEEPRLQGLEAVYAVQLVRSSEAVEAAQGSSLAA